MEAAAAADHVHVVALQHGAMAAAALVGLWLAWRAVWHLVWRPYAVGRRFERQGIRGPPYRVAVGSLLECRRMLIAGSAGGALDAGCQDYGGLVYPFFRKWTAQYGKTFLFWWGPVPTICSTDMDVIMQVLANKTDAFIKEHMNPSFEDAMGKGMLVAEGDDWRRHRKVVNLVFNRDRLKSISEILCDATRRMMERWSKEMEESSSRNGGQQQQTTTVTDIKSDAHELSLEVIARVVFGDDYREAGSKEILAIMDELKALVVFAFLDPPIPGFRFLPTRRNRRSRQLDKLWTSKIMQIVKARLAAGGGGDDLLGVTLDAWSKGELVSIHEVVGECKTFFVAGEETSANLLTWAMFLLSQYTSWQDMVRAEILREFPGDTVPTVDALGKLKLLNMCVLEALRMYNPIPIFMKRAVSETVLANKVEVPKGAVVIIPVAMLHRDKDVWGADAHEFNPARFEHGASRAGNHPNAMMAFSYGARACSGQSFAMVEVRTAMAMLLRRFSFSVSPAYVHKPTLFGALVPRYGVPLVVTKLKPAAAAAAGG